MSQVTKILPCRHCNEIKPRAADGLCRTCYSRLRTTGTLEKQVRAKSICMVAGCASFVVSHGYCDKHRLQIRNHGRITTKRPDDWGAKEIHPLYQRWIYIKRNKRIVAEWTDFWAFVKDVEGTYIEDHSVAAINVLKPLGPNNFIWKAKAVIGANPNKAERARNYRLSNPHAAKAADLRKNFGISMDYYSHMVEKQNNLCAICGKPEVVKDKNGNIRALAVDHCHKDGTIRGLLCTKCNQGVGSFLDSVELLQKAIDYLKLDRTISLNDL